MFARLFVLFAVVNSALGRTTWRDLAEYTFEKYVQEFEHSWAAGSPEWESHKQTFLTELARVREHNAANKGWKEGVNKFTAMSPAEKKAYKGRSKAIDQKHVPKNARPLPADFVMKPVSELPTSVDWRSTGIVSPVKDQGRCGSCWAFASTATIESHVAKASGLLFDLSVQQIAMCSPNPDQCGGTGGCEGATAEVAFDYVSSIPGLYQEYQLGYSAYTGVDSACATPAPGVPKAAISGFVQLPENNYTALMNAVAQVGPIAISVDASWSGYESGIYTCAASATDIDHAVVLVGYGEENGQKYWLVRNSWSPTWGEKGYIRLTRSDDDENNCAIDNTPTDGTACGGDTTPVKICGTCGILYDSAYPTGAKAL